MEKDENKNFKKCGKIIRMIAEKHLGKSPEGEGLSWFVTDDPEQAEKATEVVSHQFLVVLIERGKGKEGGDSVKVIRQNRKTEFKLDGKTGEEFIESLPEIAKLPDAEAEQKMWFYTAFSPCRCDECGVATYAGYSPPPKEQGKGEILLTYCPVCYEMKANMGLITRGEGKVNVIPEG